MEETSSPQLARFLFAQEIVTTAKIELKEVEDRARRLRGQLSIHVHELTEAKSSLEQTIGDEPADGPQDPQPPHQPSAQPAAEPSPSAETKTTIKPWLRGQLLPEYLHDILTAVLKCKIANFQQVREALPHLAVSTLRARLHKAKKYGLIDSAGWGRYKLSPTAIHTFQGLRVVE